MAKYIGGMNGYMHGNPDGFGMMYIHSNKAKQNARKRKMLAKMNKRK